MKTKYIQVNQPIGTFYLISIEASILAKIATVVRRNENPDGIQREESDKRIKEIAKYCGDTDATFPTSIIVAVDDDAPVKINENFIEFDENSIIGEIIDGQHRLGGLKSSNYLAKFQLPVVLMFNMIPQEKAYVFSIINSKQTKVNVSLIYDLFELSSNRSPFKTCHETARALNKEKDSPFYNRLKMLGKKEEGQELASLSQGTFIKYMLELISKKPEDDAIKIKRGESLIADDKLVLRDFFIREKDSVILKIMINLFTGVVNNFNEEWNNPNNYILSKSIGFGAILKSFPYIYEKGREKNDLTVEFFTKIFSRFRQHLENQGIELTSDQFGSNEQARTKLSKLIIESLK
jgi:DGQHR domain-containing protein